MPRYKKRGMVFLLKHLERSDDDLAVHQRELQLLFGCHIAIDETPAESLADADAHIENLRRRGPWPR